MQRAYLVEELVEEPSQQVVDNIVPAIRVELEQILHDTHLDRPPRRGSILVQSRVHLFISRIEFYNVFGIII